MSKIYSAVDADEAEQFIGQEGYLGDTVDDIRNKKHKCILENILGTKFSCRFRKAEVDGYYYPFALFQPIEKDDMEKALDLLGKKMKRKDGDYYKIFTDAFDEYGEVFLCGRNGDFSLQTVLEEFEIVE